MAFTIPEIIGYSQISQYLAVADIRKKGLFGGGIDLGLPNKIYNIRKILEYWYDLDPTDDNLEFVGNYLMAICGRYFLQAQSVSGAAGTVAAISSLSAPDPLQFIVAASGTTFIDGQTSVTLSSFIGFNIVFVRGGITQSDVSTEPTYYNWSRNTGVLTINIAAGTGELFQIYPV